jgi:hypothetical protein
MFSSVSGILSCSVLPDIPAVHTVHCRLELLGRAGVPPRWQMVEPDALPGQGWVLSRLKARFMRAAIQLSSCSKAFARSLLHTLVSHLVS